MTGLHLFLAAIVVYIITARYAVKRLRGRQRELVFSFLNLSGFYIVFFYDADKRHHQAFCMYVALVTLQYVMLLLFAKKEGWKPWIAFFTPITALIVIRYLPSSFYGISGGQSWGPYFIGISYLAFRSSHLVLEVRNGAVETPGIWDYFSFCFFVPTMSVGPINTYSNFRRAFDADPPLLPQGRAALRILVGLVKYKFLGTICYQLTYSGFLMDDHYHSWIDLMVAIVFYYLYLYFNFSGFCDMAIGTAGLIGVPVPENFNNPFAARNVKDFWNRWHITLSQYMRDVVFSPLSKFLVRAMGVKLADHAIALTIVIVFLLVGVWHGTGWNFAAFGAVHAIGVVANHYYTIWLKRWLGRDRFKAYNSSPWIHAAAVGITFCYVAASMIFFANTIAEMKEILSFIR